MSERDPNAEDRLDPNTLSFGCPGCSQFGPCGGYTRAGGGWDCMDECRKCDVTKCQLVCLRKPDHFAVSRAAVGGFGCSDIPALPPPAASWPTYLPLVQHGCFRADPAYVDWAAVPLGRVLKCRGNRYEPAFADGGELRRGLGLGPHTRVVLSSIGNDRPLERYWERRRDPGVLESLVRLDLEAVVVPNFSYFHQDPRTHHLYNRKRSLRCAAELARLRVPVVPYFHAITDGDVRFWEEFLSVHSEITTLAQEFQTGPKRPDRGIKCLDDLARVQEHVGRPIRVVAVGGLQFAEELAARFDESVVITSGPFLAGVNRHVYQAKQEGKWTEKPAPGENPRVLFETNASAVRRYCDQVRRQATASAGRRPPPLQTGASRGAGAPAIRIPTLPQRPLRQDAPGLPTQK